MRKTQPMIFEIRTFGNKIGYLRAYKLQNGKFTIATLNQGDTEWKPGIIFPNFKSKRSAEKWLKERYDVVKD